MALPVGTRLGTYEIVAPLGAGGMGEVYRARDLRLGREVALKILHADGAAEPERLARFEREARTVAGLNHPNIVVLFSVEDEDEVRFLTMELVEGRSLADLVTPEGLPLPQVLDVGVAIADALAAAHEKGVVHRDLKPANVMVTREGRVKVLDFGLAKLAPVGTNEATQGPTLDLTRTGAGVIAGTLPYMAPEQVLGSAVDARTDLFAFGVVLYELLAGRRPFSGASAMAVGAAILNLAPTPLSSARDDVPADLEHIVHRCLEKDPGERVQTALDLASELRRLRRVLEREAPGRAAAGKVASIAVLPFINRSRDEDDEYFSDGLADELIGMLAKIRGLRVAARSSAFTFKGRQVAVSEVGHALNVATVLEGSVRKAGNRVRIAVQLVKVSDGYHLWSETYERTLDDIFAVQDEIAQAVVRELRTTLLGESADSDASGRVKAEVAKAARGRGTDPEAHRLYLLARHLLDRFTREDTAKALDYLERAVKLDPRFALAWAELGGVHIRRASWGWAPVAEGYERARAAVHRALEIEPDLSEGHAQMAGIRLSYDWDFRGADESIARALELAPDHPPVLRMAVRLARVRRRIDEAIALYQRSLERDPLSAAAYAGLGTVYFDRGRFGEAEQASRRSLELAPQRAVSRAQLALTLVALGRAEEALAEAKREPEQVYRLWATSIVQHALGHRAESDAALQALVGLRADGAAYQIADAYAVRGEPDAAFEWLEVAYEQRDPGLPEMRSNPSFRSLHGDPRWTVLTERMGYGD